MVFWYYPSCFSLRDHSTFEGKKSESQGQGLGASMFIKFLVILRFTKFGKVLSVSSFPYPLVDILRRRKERGRNRGQQEVNSVITLVCQVQFGLYLPHPTGALSPCFALPGIQPSPRVGWTISYV